MKIWVLTEEWNMYDQMGEYYLKFFTTKPTPDQLEKTIVKLIGNEIIQYGSDNSDHINMLLNKGSNADISGNYAGGSWYNLREVESEN